MTLPATKLRAARLAAAEMFIVEGLQGTNWGGGDHDADDLRRVAAVAFFHVRWYVGEKGWVDVEVAEEKRGKVSVFVEAQKLGRMSADGAAATAESLDRVARIAWKVEAAIAEALR